jgi:hypothetical protein
MTNEEIKKVLDNGKPSFIRLRGLARSAPTLSTGGNTPAELPEQYGVVVTQNQYLLELNPSGHIIYDRTIYPDKIVKRKVELESGEEFETNEIEQIARISVPFQRVITTKQKNHITGRPVKFIHTDIKPTQAQKKDFVAIRQNWIDKNMDVAFAECVEGQLTTGDVALYFFRDKGKLDWEVFSFAKGDCLIPYYDSFNRLVKLYRYFKVRDELGNELDGFMEINDTEVVEYRNKKKGRKREWEEFIRKRHGFSQTPVLYKRGKVAWDDVQETIESTEWAFSQFCESNAYFAFPILFVAGEVLSAPQKDVQGKILEGSETTKVNYVSRNAGDMEAFKYQLEQMLNFIFMGSFSVNITPDVIKSSGDMPGSAIRLILHPEIDKAIELSKEWDDFIDGMKDLFVEGVGLEDGKLTQYQAVNFRTEIEIYIPENTTEIVNNLNQSISQKSLSAQTAQEKNPYAVPDENERYKEELKEEMELKNQHVSPNKNQL